MAKGITSVLLVGNPNSGKTTLFNALTGENQKIGNWPGVTVEKKQGHYNYNAQSIQVTDLPGIYTLSALSKTGLDEKIAAEAVITADYEIIVNVVDACHLERHLYLTSQLMELTKPIIIVLTMMDLAKQQGIKIKVDELSRQLNCPVITVQAFHNVTALKQQLALKIPASTPLQFELSPKDSNCIKKVKDYFSKTQQLSDQSAYYQALRTIETSVWTDEQALILPSDLDIRLADARYRRIHAIVLANQQKVSDSSNQLTAQLDKWFLHRFLAIPIFLLIIYSMFVFAINIGGIFKDFFDISSNALFVQGLAYLLEKLQAPVWLIGIIATGIGKGINTTITFIPVIAAMFFFLSLLEASGYMARAAFVMDKLMRYLGLPGKAFIPMIVGLGCNVPAIMAARTLESEQDRILAAVMSPFMSCSARLAIYTLFVNAFFPVGGQNIVFSLYLIGIIMAIFTGFIVRKVSLAGEIVPLVLELPNYHRPHIRRLCRETWLRLRYFIVRAAKVIIPVSVIIGSLNALTIEGGLSYGNAHSNSILSVIGQWLTPLFTPLGIHKDNWPATVGLLTGMLAKEVVIGSLNTLYSQVDKLTSFHSDFNLLHALKEAVLSIPENISQLTQALYNPIAASTPKQMVNQEIYGAMNRYFDGKVGAYAYLLLVLLYIPCISTMAAIKQETNRKWMWFSIIWSSVIAYLTAVVFYQVATFYQHPLPSILWITMMASLLLLARFLVLKAEGCSKFSKMYV